MSAHLIDEQPLIKPKQSTPKPNKITVSRTVVNRHERVEPNQCYSIPPVTNDEEMRLVRNVVIWMAVLAVTPLILFYIITFFYPDIFMIEIAP